MAFTYNAYANVTYSTGVHHMALGHRSSSTALHRVSRVFHTNNQTASITGVLVQMALVLAQCTVADTAPAGTAISTHLTKYNSDVANVFPATSFILGPMTSGFTVLSTLMPYSITNQNPIVTNARYAELTALVEMGKIWDAGYESNSNIEMFTLRPRQIASIQQLSVATGGGTGDVRMEFTNE